MSLEWTEAALDALHDRSLFDCGDAQLNEYLQKYARQNHRAGGAKCFIVASAAAPKRITAFYTLSAASLDYARTPAVVRKGLGRYDVPLFRLGRLAVDRDFQGRGHGGFVFVLAARRCLRVASDVGGVGLLIDAKNDRVAAWYASFGAVRLDDAPLSLILPLATLTRAHPA